MKTFLQINPKRILAIAGLAGVLGLSGTAIAQTHTGRVYADVQAYKNAAIPIIGAASVANAGNAVSASIRDSSTLSISGVGSATTQYLRFSNGGSARTIAPGTPIHVKFSAPAGVLGLNLAGLLGNLEIGVFSGLSGTTNASVTSSASVAVNGNNGGSLVSLLSGAGTNELIFNAPTGTTTQGVYVKISGLLSAGFSTNLFSAYIYDNLAGDGGCPKPIDWVTGAGAGQLASVGSATGTTVNPQAAIDDDPTFSTAATLNLGVQLTGSSYYTAILNTPAKAGDSVRVVINNPNGGLLNLDVLSGFTIQAYDGATAVGSPISSGSALLKVQLLPGSTGKNIITAAIGGSYDRISFTYGGLATTSGLLGNGNIAIYDIGSKVPAPVVTGSLTKNVYKGNTVDLSTFATMNTNGDPIVWKDSATDAIVASSFVATASKTLLALSSRDGCPDASGADTIHLHVSVPASPGLATANVGVPYSQQVDITPDATVTFPASPVYQFTLVSTDGVVGIPFVGSSLNRYAMATAPTTFAAGPMNANLVFVANDLGKGLSMDENGLVTGTPTSEGTINFTVSVFDAANNLEAGTFDKSIVIGAALPINLSSFVANLDANKNVVLQWKTESEQNYVRFDVLRSNDGSNFTKIGDVKAAGNSSSVNNYKFVDKNPGLKSYYKVNIVTSDNGTSGTNVISISSGKISGFSVSPNPASNDITITGIDNNDIASVNIYDASGRLVLTATQGSINVHSLSAGIYFVTVVQKDGSKSNSKFLKK